MLPASLEFFILFINTQLVCLLEFPCGRDAVQAVHLHGVCPALTSPPPPPDGKGQLTAFMSNSRRQDALNTEMLAQTQVVTEAAVTHLGWRRVLTRPTSTCCRASVLGSAAAPQDLTGDVAKYTR